MGKDEIAKVKDGLSCCTEDFPKGCEKCPYNGAKEGGMRSTPGTDYPRCVDRLLTEAYIIAYDAYLMACEEEKKEGI